MWRGIYPRRVVSEGSGRVVSSRGILAAWPLRESVSESVSQSISQSVSIWVARMFSEGA